MSAERKIVIQTKDGQRVRIVTKWFGEECWWKYYIFYRPLERRLADLLHAVHVPVTGMPDPGGPFASAPWLYKRTRKAVVFAQQGGLDI